MIRILVLAGLAGLALSSQLARAEGMTDPQQPRMKASASNTSAARESEWQRANTTEERNRILQGYNP